jgi:uncharacterized protein (TIRG00374 family)
MAIPKSFRKKLLLSMGLGAVVFLILALIPDREEILKALNEFNWIWMPVALALALLNYGIRAIRWHWYLRKLKVPLPPRESIPIFLIGLMLSATPGKAGELFKAYLVKLATNVPMSHTAPAVVVERLTDMTGMLILATLGLMAIQVQGALVIVLWVLMLFGLAILSSKGIMHGLLQFLGRFVSGKMRIRIERAYDSLSALISMPYLLGATMMSAVAWFAECLSLMAILYGFGVHTGWIECTFIYSLSTLAGAALFFMPGGIGGTEAAMVGLLREIAGVGEGVASLATVLTRAATLWFAVAIGFVALFFCPLEVAENIEAELEDETA